MLYKVVVFPSPVGAAIIVILFLLLKLDFKPQDAREVLPLDTATKVVYTYTVDEWNHILDLRYREVTGKAHPNAKIIASYIAEDLDRLGYDIYNK